MLPLAASISLLVPFLTLTRAASEAEHGIVKFPITAVNRLGLSPGSGHAKRQDAVPLSNGKTGTLYTIQLSLGTPPQPVVVVIDTGSSDLWVNPTCTGVPEDQYEFCASFPRFDHTASGTFNETGDTFQLKYGKGEALLVFGTDVVALGSVVLEGQIFGVNVDSIDIPLGILGLAPFLGGSSPRYPFVLDTMVAQGEINSRAFSLDLRSIDSPDGSVIFGGIDTKKYTGSLEKTPIIPAAAAPFGTDRYWIYLTSVGITPPTGPSAALYEDASPGLPVILDSGGTITRLPTPLYRAIGEAFIAVFPNTVLDAESGYYVVDCSIADSPGSVDFGCGTKTIRVAYKDVIWSLGRPDLDICVVGVLPDDGNADEPVLGDSFLRAAYVVYDQDNRNLHLAQAANCGTELVAIGKGPDAVPSVTGGCGDAEPSSSTTTPGSTTKPTTSTSSATETSTPDSVTTSSSSYPDTTTPATITSTLTRTDVYTVTSCPPTVTHCPYGQVTTEVVTLTTTFCPESTTSYPATEKPVTTLSVSAPCLNCDKPSSSPSITSIAGTGSLLPSSTATTKPTAVVTAGAERGLVVLRAAYVVVVIAGAALLV
ncbi:aspartic peptidase domain-containing protein [Coniochaeta sp. 2T2.1]|nr:aspartic peptidase domain-containing protein [Coniochaeta sp. 2T2.1]